MLKNTLLVIGWGTALALFASLGDSPRTTDANAATDSRALPLQEASIEHGKYLVQVGGCNDCHTPGYTRLYGDVPESEWLRGDSLGWRGPWGTTYAANLRLLLPGFAEDEWLAGARAMRPRPPMPWFNLRAMSDADLRSIYRLVISLGVAGAAAPAYVPPDAEPSKPFVRFP